MARVEKGSRIRTLPPKVQIQQNDSVTGSYPSNARFSTDGRTGDYSIWFDDRYTPIFSQSNVLRYPIGIPSSYNGITLTGFSEEVTDLNNITGSFRKGIGDKFIKFDKFPTCMPQPLTPFKDNGNFEVDGKSNQPGNNSDFYSTGSKIEDVGDGFSSPLWSKQKIEIDIPVEIQTTIVDSTGSISVNQSGSYRIAYYNFVNKCWEGIGTGRGNKSFADTFDAANNFTCGVSPSFILGVGTSTIKNSGLVINTFGFPAAPLYHATSSQTYKLSASFNQPFLVEKAVLITSASFNVGTILPVVSSHNLSSSVNTVFILNQRKNANFNYYQTIYENDANFSYQRITVPTQSVITSGGSAVAINTIREVVSFHRILSCASGAFEKRTTDQFSASLSSIRNFDTLITSSTDTTITGVNWTRKLQLNMTAKSPTQLNNAYYGTIYLNDSPEEQIYISNLDGGRSGVGFEYVGGRSLVSEYAGTEADIRPTNTSIGGVTIQRGTVRIPGKINPYIFYPSDELIIGWHLPILSDPNSQISTPGTGSSITFFTGSYKLVLYGTYISEGKEYNDTLNQLLTSNVVHEVIE